jgi:hypothetical protein
MMKSILVSLLIMFTFSSAHASSSASTDLDSQSGDWGQLRQDVTESASRSGSSSDIGARRQAIRDGARAKFREADSDGNGSLNKTELGRARPGLVQHFSLIDDDKNGQVTENEIVQARKKLMQMRRQESGQTGSNRGNNPNQTPTPAVTQ